MYASRISIIALIAVLSGQISTPAQNVTAEAGKYERKSVTYVNALWLMDPTVKNLPADRVGMMLDKVKNGLFMRRFDYNPVPEALITDFVTRINAMNFPAPPEGSEFSAGIAAAADPMLDSVTSVMEQTILPRILETVDAAKESRAAALTTEEQRNSFIADKAKTLGITMDDVNKVMNSAYVFIPLVRRHYAVLKDSSYSVGIDAGIIWFHIVTTGEKARAVPVVRRFTRSTGFSAYKRSYATSDGVLDYQEFAFRAAVKNAVRNLVAATQEIPDFNLSGQVVERRLLGVSFDAGKYEGVHVDDKYKIMESTENADGSVTQKENGWVMVSSVADSNTRGGYKSRAQIIAGNPYTGAVLREFPRIPIDIALKGRMFAFRTDSATARDSVFDSLSLSGGWGAGIDARYNLGRMIGLGQFFFDFGFGMGWGGATGKGILPLNATHPLDTVELGLASNMNFEASLIKKFYLGRVALSLQPTYAWQVVSVQSTPQDSSMVYSWRTISSGFAMHGGLELALHPALNLGVGAGWQLLENSSTWDIQQKKETDKWKDYDNGKGLKGTTVNHTGLTAEVYLNWSVPALPFDPVDLVRGVSGL